MVHQRQAAAPKTRTSLCGVRFFFARVFTWFHFCSVGTAASCRSPFANLTFVWFANFFCLWLERGSIVCSVGQTPWTKETHLTKCGSFARGSKGLFHFRAKGKGFGEMEDLLLEKQGIEVFLFQPGKGEPLKAVDVTSFTQCETIPFSSKLVWEMSMRKYRHSS